MKIFALFYLFSFSFDWILQGLQHPLLTPSHAIIMVALAFLIAQQNMLLKYSLALFVGIVGGMLLNYFLNLELMLEPILLILALSIGLLVVLRIKQAPKVIIIVSLFLALVTGLLLGLDSNPIKIPGLGSNGILNWRIGAVFSIIISVLILSLAALSLRRFGDGIILRVLGSWVATSALITLSLQFTKM